MATITCTAMIFTTYDFIVKHHAQHHAIVTCHGTANGTAVPSLRALAPLDQSSSLSREQVKCSRAPIGHATQPPSPPLVVHTRSLSLPMSIVLAASIQPTTPPTPRRCCARARHGAKVSIKSNKSGVGVSASAPPVGAPYLADLDGSLLKFGTTPGDARRTFKFYLRMEQEVCRTPPTAVAAATHARKAPQPHAATAIVGNHLSTALPLHRASP